MRGNDRQQGHVFSYLSPEQRVRQDHPLRPIRAMLVQMLYTVRSERLLMEQLDYNILFRWFVGLNLDDAVWVPTVFTKNRDRLLEGAVAKEFLARVVQQARAQGWAGDEHFTVDGTLLEAWAGAKGFQPRIRRIRKKSRMRRRRRIPEIPRWIFTASGAATQRTNRKAIPTRCWRAKAKARRPS